MGKIGPFAVCRLPLNLKVGNRQGSFHSFSYRIHVQKFFILFMSFSKALSSKALHTVIVILYTVIFRIFSRNSEFSILTQYSVYTEYLQIIPCLEFRESKKFMKIRLSLGLTIFYSYKWCVKLAIYIYAFLWSAC